jgi:hypothetical protein
MGKSYKANNEDSHSHSRRSNVARGMIISGTGIARKFGDKRDKRKQNPKKAWIDLNTEDDLTDDQDIY